MIEPTVQDQNQAQPNEREVRIYYQDIVYAVCNFLDAALGNSSYRGTGLRADKQEIMVAMMKLFHDTRTK